MFLKREEVKEQLEKKKKGSRALAEFEEKMNEVCEFDLFDVSGLSGKITRMLSFPLSFR